MDIVRKIAFILLVIGGLNWGLVGAIDWNIVDKLLPEIIAQIVYILVGVSALVVIFLKGDSESSEEESMTSNQTEPDPMSDPMNGSQM